jgi:hypothetical protein
MRAVENPRSGRARRRTTAVPLPPGPPAASGAHRATVLHDVHDARASAASAARGGRLPHAVATFVHRWPHQHSVWRPELRVLPQISWRVRRKGALVAAAGSHA